MSGNSLSKLWLSLPSSIQCTVIMLSSTLNCNDTSPPKMSTCKVVCWKYFLFDVRNELQDCRMLPLKLTNALLSFHSAVFWAQRWRPYKAYKKVPWTLIFESAVDVEAEKQIQGRHTQKATTAPISPFPKIWNRGQRDVTQKLAELLASLFVLLACTLIAMYLANLIFVLLLDFPSPRSPFLSRLVARS